MAVVYRRFPEAEYVVRSMMEEDVDTVLGWWRDFGAMASHELTIALKIFGQAPGLYIGEHRGEVVASAVRLPWTVAPPRVMYGSLYYVAPEQRGKGFGTMLRDQVAREHVADSVLYIDAVEGKVAESNERKFGYESLGQFCRYTMTAQAYEGQHEDFTLKHGGELAFERLAAFDDQHFIAANNPARHAFLREWINVPGGGCVAAVTSSGEILGYGCRLPCMQEGSHLIEPLYAVRPEVAEVLLRSLAGQVAGQEVFINTYGWHEESQRLVRRLGMRQCISLVRQHLNGGARDSRPGAYAVTSIDVCGF